MSEVNVAQRPALPTETEVGADLREHIESRDLAISWQPMNELTTHRLHARGIRVFDVNDLKTDRPEFYQQVKREYLADAEGRIQRGDCFLCVQPIDLRQQILDQEAYRRKLMESGHRATEEAREMAEGEAKRFGLPSTVTALEGQIPDELPIEVSKGERAARLNIKPQA